MGFISDMFWAPWIGFYVDTTATLPCVIVHVIGLVLQKQFNQLCPCCLHLVGFLGFVVRTVWPPGLGIIRPNWSTPDSKAHGTNMGPTWGLSAPDGPHVGPMNLAIRDTPSTQPLDLQPSQFSSHHSSAANCWHRIFSCGEQLYKHSMSVCLFVTLCLFVFVYALPGAILLGSWWNLVGAHLGLRSRPSSFVGDVAR